MNEYGFHPEAETDLVELWEYIAADNPDAADRVLDEIVAELEKLSVFPDSGHRRPDLTSRPLRFWTVRDYLIAYAPDERPLWVIAFLHGRRDPRVLAAILRRREGAR
jgi:plasmid stabilization system protein ParE